MVTFDSRDPGTSRAVWAADDRWSAVPVLSLEGVGRVVVAAAHPDDETLGAGGLMAECFALDIPVTVVLATNGDASHPGSPTVDAATMARRRSAEVHQAVDLLAPGSEVIELGVADGAVDAHADAIRTALLRVAGSTPPSGRTLLVAPWRGDNHPDHRMLGELCAEVAAALGLQLLEYPIWLWHWATPDSVETPWPTFARLPLGEWSAVSKDRAISAHRSQVEPLSPAVGDEAVLHPAFLANFDRDEEIFVTDAQHSMTGAAAETRAQNVVAKGESTLPAAFFDETYQRAADPWGFTSRWYEERKRAATMAALPRGRYESAYEIGCSIGVLTELLAGRCDSLLSVDISAIAVQRARERLSRASAPHPGVTLEVADATDSFAAGPFDLIVLSEVGYYWSPSAFAGVLRGVDGTLTATGHVLACHWRHTVPEYPRGGDDVHAQLAQHASQAAWTRLVQHVEEDFVLEVYSPGSASVARETGLL